MQQVSLKNNSCVCMYLRLRIWCLIIGWYELSKGRTFLLIQSFLCPLLSTSPTSCAGFTATHCCAWLLWWSWGPKSCPHVYSENIFDHEVISPKQWNNFYILRAKYQASYTTFAKVWYPLFLVLYFHNDCRPCGCYWW